MAVRWFTHRKNGDGACCWTCTPPEVLSCTGCLPGTVPPNITGTIAGVVDGQTSACGGSFCITYNASYAMVFNPPLTQTCRWTFGQLDPAPPGTCQPPWYADVTAALNVPGTATEITADMYVKDAFGSVGFTRWFGTIAGQINCITQLNGLVLSPSAPIVTAGCDFSNSTFTIAV